MNPFAHFEDQFGHLKLSDNDAALHVFLAGWNSAMMEMMQRVNKMPFQNDTRASFAVYFQSQMVNVDAIEKPAQQEPVAVVSGYYGGQCVILPIDPARIFNSNTALYTSPQPAQQEPVAWADECRIELVNAIHFLASDFENALGAFGGDTEARRKAEGDIARARSIASRWNWNGTAPPAQRKPLTDEQIIQIASMPDGSQATTKGYVIPFARAIEAAHGIGEKK